MTRLPLRALAAAALAISVASCAGGMPQEGAVVGTANWGALSFEKANDQKPVVLYYGDRDKLTQLLNAGADVHSVDVKKKRAVVAINKSQAELAKKLGMGVEIRQDLPTNRVDQGYRTFEQITAKMKELAAAHPQFVQLVDIGDSWEKTQKIADRDIWALKIGTPGAGKPKVVFAGCHHSREIVTPEMVLMQAEAMVAGYGKDAETTAAIEGRETWLVPMVNPDGHHIVMTKGIDQRKNGNNATGGKRRVGVDLNRNYDAVWGTVGDSGSPEADTFRGTKPFSEPESQAVRDLIRATKPAVYLTFHSYSNCVMWPYDSTREVPADKRLPILGKALGKQSGYEAYQGAEMYLNSGDDVEWAYRELGTLAYTVEIGGWGDGFMPAYNKVPKFFKENSAMMNYALKVADNPAVAAGVEAEAALTRAGVTVQAPGAAQVEYFYGKPGAAGTGAALAAGQAIPVRQGRELVYAHAKDAKGQWGPWAISWTK